MYGVFLVVGIFFVLAISIPLIFVFLSMTWCWLSAAYAIWKGYVTAHDAEPDLGIVKSEFRDRYGKHWRWLLLGAITTQYRWLMSHGFGIYQTKWFDVDLRQIKPVIYYHIKEEKEK